MDLHDYRVFEKIVETGSISETAAALNYSQPAVSHIVSAMEKECGFPLFVRSKKGTVLTDQGKVFADYVRAVLAAEERVGNAIAHINGEVTGRIRVGSYFSLQEQVLPSILAELSRNYPQISYMISGYEPNGERDFLRRSQLDVGIGMSDVPAGYRFIPLFHDASVVVLPPGHPLTKKHAVKPAELLAYPLLLQDDRCANELKAAFREDFGKLDGRIIFNNDRFLLRMAEKGLGLGMTSSVLLGNSDYRLEVRPLDPPQSRIIGLILPNWKPISPALQCFIDTAIRLYREDCFSD